MFSLHCDLYIPDGLKKLFKDRQTFPSVWTELTFQCEIGIHLQKTDNAQPDETAVKIPMTPESSLYFGNESTSWKNIKNLIHDGMKLLNEDSLQFTVNVVVEFPARDSENDEDSVTSAILEPRSESNIQKEFRDNISRLENLVDHEPELVRETRRILALNRLESVELCSEGTGGTYFIKNEQGKKIAVFKPTDEEPGADCNPKGKIQDPLLPPGGGSIREVAAYVLDQGFAGVPETYLVSRVEHPGFSSVKSGSLQRYMDNAEDRDISSSRFSVADVHKIGILDVRLYNMDRNEENILIQNPANPKLIPIDHSYVLPPELSFLWFEWLHWKQAKQPFSAELLDYIRSIDIQKDAAVLRELGFESAAIRTMMISTSLLKIAASKYGYNLFQIGTIMSQKKPKEMSLLERIVKKTEDHIKDTDNQDQFLETLGNIIEQELDNTNKKTQ